MITLVPKEYDDPQFVELISRTLTALAHCYKPIEIYKKNEFSWYGSFLKKEDWRIYKVRGISRIELTRLTEMFVPEPGV